MKYSKSMRVVTIVVILMFLVATFGTVVLYLTNNNQQTHQEQEINAYMGINPEEPKIESVRVSE